jgi:hypothetical protein
MIRNIYLIAGLCLVTGLGCSDAGQGADPGKDRTVSEAVQGSSAVPENAKPEASEEFNKLPKEVRDRMGGQLQKPGN